MEKSQIQFLNPIPAIEIIQGSEHFYVFSIPAKLLLSIAYTSERTKNNRTGIQRGLRKERLGSIGKYLKGEVSGQPILPNTIIISLSNDSFFKDGLINIANKPNAEAFVIDGQHRLWSFDTKYSGETDFPIVVSAFKELPDAKKALIFRTINGEQRKINPSLVYDLIPMLRNTDWVKFEDARSQELVEALNSNSDSPWANRISMVGEAGKIISQSSFITAIKKLFKKDHIFYNNSELFEETIQEKILLIYFNKIADLYSVEWDNKDFLLCKYVGVSALLNLFEKIIEQLVLQGKNIIENDELAIQTHDFESFLKKLRKYNFSAKEAKAEGKSYVGEGGVNELTKKIILIVFS